MAVSKSYFVLRCTASATWCCARLAFSECRVIFVSVEHHCSPLKILVSLGVAVGGRERDTAAGECHTTGIEGGQIPVLLVSGRVTGKMRWCSWLKECAFSELPCMAKQVLICRRLRFEVGRWWRRKRRGGWWESVGGLMRCVYYRRATWATVSLWSACLCKMSVRIRVSVDACVCVSGSASVQNSICV